MAGKAKGRKKKEEFNLGGNDTVDKPTKEEYYVAKWMRQNVPIKKTKFVNHNVEYFTGSKAVDALLTSKWSSSNSPKDSSLFSDRPSIEAYLNTMLRHKFFHRARKVPVSEQELLSRRKQKDSGNKKQTQQSQQSSSEEGKKPPAKDEKQANTDAESNQDDKDRRKRKIRLEMHNDQRFSDGLDAYVWLYEPTPVYYWLFGTLMVLGAIGICMFPLWPQSVRNGSRKGVYYFSIAGAGFLIFIIGLAVLRFVIFCLLWVLTMGKHHLWLFPNLTEDVGFFASFWPIFKYEYKGPEGSGSSEAEQKKKKKKSEKDSDEEEEKGSVTGGGGGGSTASTPTQHKVRTGSEARKRKNQRPDNRSESESESSQRSSTGKDFEMVDQEDFES